MSDINVTKSSNINSCIYIFFEAIGNWYQHTFVLSLGIWLIVESSGAFFIHSPNQTIEFYHSVIIIEDEGKWISVWRIVFVYI